MQCICIIYTYLTLFVFRQALDEAPAMQISSLAIQLTEANGRSVWILQILGDFASN